MKDRKENKRNVAKQKELFEKICEYLVSGNHSELYFRVALQDGVIQTIQCIDWDKKKAKTV